MFHNPYNQLTTSPVHMVSAVPESLMDYMAFNTNNALNQQGLEFPEVAREIKKAVVKKDRHSKIHTAQGLRDRRVRLSIGIARQFFDLQDMLGFDKASKTLEWLLKKSRKDIKKVVQGKKLKNDDEDFGNNGGDVEEEEEDEDDDNDGGKSFVFGSSPEYFEEEVVCEVKKAEKRNKKSELSNVSSKGSRTNAKGKAKEVTFDHQETLSDIAQSEIIDPFKRSIIFNKGEEISHSHVYKEAIEELDNQGYILAKSKINLQTNMGQSYNEYNETFMLMDQGSTSSNNYNTLLPQNLDYNYDQNPFIDQTFCAIANPNFPKGFP